MGKLSRVSRIVTFFAKELAFIQEYSRNVQLQKINYKSCSQHYANEKLTKIDSKLHALPSKGGILDQKIFVKLMGRLGDCEKLKWMLFPELDTS